MKRKREGEPQKADVVETTSSREHTTSVEHASPSEARESVAETPEAKEAREKQIEEIRRNVAEQDSEGGTVSDPQTLNEYVSKHLPARLKETSIVGKSYEGVARLGLRTLETLGIYKIEGREHVPEDGPCLVIANHTRFFDETKLTALFDRPSHIVSADMHFDMSPVHRWFMKKIGAIEVEASLRQLSNEEKEALMQRVPVDARGYYRRVIEREKQPASMTGHRTFVRTTVAALVKGDPVILFPEGLWLYEGNKMRKAYPGMELIASEFRKVTGQDLPVLPVGILDRGLTVGELTAIRKGDTTDDLMRTVATLLPEEARGYYNDGV